MKKPNKILITGASGCVGQYTAAWLLENSNAELFLWLRDPKKLTSISPQHPRVNLLIGDLRDSEKFRAELSIITRVIHTATAWGDPQRAYEVNVVAVKNLLAMLNPKLIEQITYFSTASILNKSLKPLPQALSYGTEYIQTKAQCLKELETHYLAEKIVAVFPTLVFGGRVDNKSKFPSSYLTDGLTQAFKWLWLARFLRLDSRFHFIHAADIAFICGHLATTPHFINNQTNPGTLTKFVLAQPEISINTAIQTLCKWKGLRETPSITLSNLLIKILIKILPIEITDWDRFSIHQRHFVHSPITSPESFGGESHASTLEDVLQISGIPKLKRYKSPKSAKV